MDVFWLMTAENYPWAGVLEMPHGGTKYSSGAGQHIWKVRVVQVLEYLEFETYIV